MGDSSNPNHSGVVVAVNGSGDMSSEHELGKAHGARVAL